MYRMRSIQSRGPLFALVGHAHFSTVANTSTISFGGCGCAAVKRAASPDVLVKDRAELDFDFLLDETNRAQIAQNVATRKGIGDIDRLHAVWAQIRRFAPFTTTRGPNEQHLRALWDELYALASLLPNRTDPEAPIGDASASRICEHFGPARRTEGWMLPAEKLVGGWHSLLRPVNTCGSRSYAFVGPLAHLERALLDHAFDFLLERLKSEQGIAGIELLDVNDILPVSTTRACGVQQRPGQHPIQYRVHRPSEKLELVDNTDEDLDAPYGMVKAHEFFGALQRLNQSLEKEEQNGVELAENEGDAAQHSAIVDANSYEGMCLSGTAEMGIAEKLKGRLFDEHELPLYLVAESRCFRPEISAGPLEMGLYRVHEFNKIELFVVCTDRQSGAELQRLVSIQRDLLSSLDIHCRILDMPSEELGASAARKFDVETWLPGRRQWGELCSASNCTDYQARRLHLKYRPAHSSGPTRFVHTCNGTGLASTRSVIAVLETHQRKQYKQVELPEVLKRRLPDKRRSPGIRTQRAASIKFTG